MKHLPNPLKHLLGLPELSATAFPPGSRYHGIEVARKLAADGAVQTYLRRRFVPDPDHLDSIGMHRVAGGERLDLIAARYLGDPELYWRICDGNGAIRPDELLEAVGRRLRITQPEGVRGGGDG